jgi:hypothetical protein
MKCVVCEEEITNPLCPQCLHEEMRQWLLEQGEERLAVLVEGRCEEPHGEIACVRCKRPMAVCTYCCTQDVLPLVRANTKLLMQYLAYFNFDLGHLGWEQEARAYLDD